MEKKYKVGIIGATGMVGQRFVTLMENHPWFQLTVLAASPRSAGQPYEKAVAGRWAMDTPIPAEAKELVVMDAQADVEKIAGMVDFVFCAVDMKKDEIRALEERYAKAECPVVSNNSAHRWTEDVPMVVPEMNPEHLEVIAAQRKRLGTQRGFIAVKSNCSIQSYAPALHPLLKYGIDKVLVCTYQAISGAGKTFERWPEMVDNLIPYIGGEEEKSEQEPLKVWGKVENGKIVNAAGPAITAQCLRVPVSNGHTTAAVYLSLHAQDSGADALLHVTPYYNKCSQAGLIKHYEYIADRVDLPVILYNVPSRTGVSFTAETYQVLSQNPKINGVKEASGNFSLLAHTRHLCGDDFYIWSGNDDQVVPMMSLGAKGVISVASNIIPEVMVKMTHLCLDNDFASASKLQIEYMDLIDALFCDVNPIPVKEALNLLGMEAGPVRLPLCEMEEKNKARLRAAMQAKGLL